MVWTTPGTLNNGSTITHTIYNRDAQANIAALKGQAGTLGRENSVAFCNDALVLMSLESSNPRWTVDTGDYFEYNRASNQFKFAVGGTVQALIVSTGITYASSYYSTECVAAKMHLESAKSTDDVVTNNSYADDAYTFEKPFNEIPNVVYGLQHTSTTPADYGGLGLLINRNTLTKTGVTLRKWNVSGNNHVLTSYMFAQGVHP